MNDAANEKPKQQQAPHQSPPPGNDENNKKIKRESPNKTDSKLDQLVGSDGQHLQPDKSSKRKRAGTTKKVAKKPKEQTIGDRQSGSEQDDQLASSSSGIEEPTTKRDKALNKSDKPLSSKKVSPKKSKDTLKKPTHKNGGVSKLATGTSGAKWNADEDKVLLEEIHRLLPPIPWAEIAEKLEQRDGLSCKNRWATLRKKISKGGLSFGE